MQFVKLQLGCLLIIAYVEISYIRETLRGQIPCNRYFGQHRIIRQGSSARDFVPVQSSENAGILYVFPVFGTAELVQNIR